MGVILWVGCRAPVVSVAQSLQGWGSVGTARLHHARETVAGLIEPEFTRQYWCATWQDCNWQAGASWRLMIPDGRAGDGGEILEIDSPRRLVLSWQNQFTPELFAEGHSRMTYKLEPQDDSVKFTVVHEMKRPNSKLIEGVSQGWPPIVSSLKSLLETGESLEFTRHWPEAM